MKYNSHLTKDEVRKNMKRVLTLKSQGNWVENACDVCKRGGMSKHIYEFQKANRPEGTICSSCSRKQDNEASK